jgi:hypothetical protein
VHRRTRPAKINAIGIESLTERELQVAQLVVERKIDVSSRVGLGACHRARRPNGEPATDLAHATHYLSRGLERFQPA